MSSFVLVHGSGQNASSWARVASALQARGHAVAAPDLPKGELRWRLEDYAAEIARAVTGPDTIVVAHSLCGAFLPLVAQARACGRLVFLAAVIPEPGKSMRQQFGEDPGMFAPSWIEAGPRWFDPEQAQSLAREFLFHDCDEETLEWALGTLALLWTRDLVTQPAPFREWPDVPTASIVAGDDRTLSPEWCRRTTRRVLGIEALEVQAGHCPHVSRPLEIAGLLERLAARAP